ncbi:hypothetical protein SAMN05216413_1389 [Ruminococcaceae bacterium KH2T8]|nr:hypothetical protein SAMN05216413_1389 [Ruminococcaceae bacterium KH2T8]
MKNRILKRTGACLVSAGIIMQFGVSSLAYGAADQGVAVNEQNFPDGVFRSYVSDNFDEDGDGYLCDAEIENANTIQCWGSIRSTRIADLTGIGLLPYLTRLDCSYNDLTELDVSNNTALTYLRLNSNSVEELDLSNNPALETVDCAYNNISELDFSSNTSIKILSVGHNPLTELTLGNNSELYAFNCLDTDLSELNISGVPNMILAYTEGDCVTETTNNPVPYYVYSYETSAYLYVEPDLPIVTVAEEVDPEAAEEFTTSFDVSYGSHWDSSVAPYGANVADTTASGSISFDAPVQSFTISVDGQITNDACNSLDWRYSITNNNDGTYTVTYTANQYEYNPPVSFIDGLRFTVNGDQAPVITVVEYTFY